MADGSREVTLGEAILYFKEDVTEFYAMFGQEGVSLRVAGMGKGRGG